MSSAYSCNKILTKPDTGTHFIVKLPYIVAISTALTTLTDFTSYSVTLKMATCFNHIGHQQAITFIKMMSMTDMAERCDTVTSKT
jgi:chemotaxis protein histidine kinase CheA